MEMGHSYTVKVVTKLVQYINCTTLHIYTSLKYHNYVNVNIAITFDRFSFVQTWQTKNILNSVFHQNFAVLQYKLYCNGNLLGHNHTVKVVTTVKISNISALTSTVQLCALNNYTFYASRLLMY